MNMLLESACCQDKIVASWILAICCAWFQKGICREEGTAGECVTAGIWGGGLSPSGFSHSVSWLDCERPESRFLFSSQPRLEGDF